MNTTENQEQKFKKELEEYNKSKPQVESNDLNKVEKLEILDI